VDKKCDNHRFNGASLGLMLHRKTRNE